MHRIAPDYIREFVKWGMILTIVLVPLPFGTNRPWAWSLLGGWLGGLVLCYAVVDLFQPREAGLKLLNHLKVQVALIVIVVCWIVLQQLSIFGEELAHPIWGEASAYLGRNLDPAISISPSIAKSKLTILLSYIAVFWLSAHCARNPKDAQIMMWMLIGISTCYALYGIYVVLSGDPKILWLEKVHYKESVTSTFVNRNSFATYIGISLVCSSVLFMKEIGNVLGEGHRSLVLNKLVSSKKFVVLALLGMSVFVGITALFMTNSRAGSAAVIIGLLVSVVSFAMVKYKSYKWLALVCLMIGLALLLIFSLSGAGISDRTELLGRDWDWRHETYLAVLDGIASNLWLGYGYGTFEPGFRLFKTSEIAWANWAYAHNVYLELFFELGLVGATLLLVAISITIAQVGRGIFRRRKNKAYPIVALGVSIVVMLHSMLDFSVEIPAVGVSFFVVLGIGWAQSWSSRE